MRRPEHVVSQKAQTFGMLIFLFTLAILFAATMLVYVLLRFVLGQNLPEMGYFRAEMSDWKLFLSTGLVLAASFTIHMAVKAIARERRGPFLKWLFATDLLALGFVAVQVPAMMALLYLHEPAQIGTGVGPAAERFYGLIVVLIALHALHVLGGIVYLALVSKKASDGGYDHENHTGVRHAAMYWHFLDVVWILMFATLLIAG
jgi:heme/copper-type cytochrome/quinol oxidase subunit 3